MLENPLVLLPRHGAWMEIPLERADQGKPLGFVFPLLDAAKPRPDAMTASWVQDGSSHHALTSASWTSVAITMHKEIPKLAWDQKKNTQQKISHYCFASSVLSAPWRSQHNKYFPQDHFLLKR